MKLYYSPGACSQAPHIILHETGFSHDAVKVNIREKLLPDGSDYRQVNPKGSVPALELDNGELLTENATSFPSGKSDTSTSLAPSPTAIGLNHAIFRMKRTCRSPDSSPAAEAISM